MSLPKFSVTNPVLVNMMMLVILFGGAVFAVTLVREMFPESRPDKLLIFAVYPGVQPEEIEKSVTIKIEEAIRDVEGIERVDSTVSESFSTTIVTLLNEVDDVDVVLQEVKNEVDAIENLPEDIEQMTVRKMEPKLPVISVAIYGDGDEADLKRAARNLRDELLLLPGVSDVQLNGTRDDEISVEIRPEKLLEYDITFEGVAQAIRETNLDISGGDLKGARQQISVRTLGEETRGADLEDIVVRSRPDGRKILVSDVAVVSDRFVESDLESYFNGKPSVSCVVFKTSSQDAIQIATQVKAFVAGKQGEDYDPYGFGEAYAAQWYRKPFALAGAYASRGITNLVSSLSGRPDPIAVYEQSRRNPFNHAFAVALHSDLARFVEGRLDLLTRNGRSGLMLVLLSLMIFLNWRVAFWAAVGLPVSFLGAFIVMWIFGASINLLTMFGLIIVLGIIVDDAIIVGENIYRHVEEGLPPLRAAVIGAEEVMWPVTVAVTTTIAAFSPLLFIRGQIGDFMGQLPIVVLSALSVSLVEALLILPAHLAHLPSKKEKQRRQAQAQRQTTGRLRRFAAGFRGLQERFVRGRLADTYERFLRVALRWRYVTMAVASSLLLVSIGFWKGGIVETVFIQKMDSETLVCSLEMPIGTTAEMVKEQINILAEHARETMPDEVVNVQTFVARQYDFEGFGTPMGNAQSHLGQMIIELKPADEREALGARSSEELLADFRRVSQTLAGVNSVTWLAMSGGPGGKDIHIRVTGDDFEELVLVGEKLKQELATYDGVFDLDDDVDRGKREIQLRLRESARPTGITVGMLGSHVRAAMYGREARRLTRNREDVRIMVRYPETARERVYDIESMWIPTGDPTSGPAGDRGWVPLGEVARLTETEGFTAIQRSQQERAISVFGEVDQALGNVSDILTKIRETFNTRLSREHPGVRLEFLGTYEEMGKAFGSLWMALPVALLMIFMLLAGLFRSYFQPLVVMSAIPFGLMGAIVGHWVTGNPMTVLSGIGMVALTGIVVNDSLVLVDFINTRIRNGMDRFEASIEGARLRLRAILLTTLTTVAGLTPLMFETSFQAKFLIPMAVTLTFGLIFATMLTLVIVPTLNMIYFDAVNIFRRERDE